MKICEDCIKQDVCKFREEVERFEKKHKAKLLEMLTENLECKYKYVPSTDFTIPSDTTTIDPDKWTYTGWPSPYTLPYPETTGANPYCRVTS